MSLLSVSPSKKLTVDYVCPQYVAALRCLAKCHRLGKAAAGDGADRPGTIPKIPFLGTTEQQWLQFSMSQPKSVRREMTDAGAAQQLWVARNSTQKEGTAIEPPAWRTGDTSLWEHGA